MLVHAQLYPTLCGYYFGGQEYVSRLQFPSPHDLSNPGTKPMSSMSPTLRVDSLAAEPSGKPMKEKQISAC